MMGTQRKLPAYIYLIDRKPTTGTEPELILRNNGLNDSLKNVHLDAILQPSGTPQVESSD